MELKDGRLPGVDMVTNQLLRHTRPSVFHGIPLLFRETYFVRVMQLLVLLLHVYDGSD